jgi:hypothetical protein
VVARWPALVAAIGLADCASVPAVVPLAYRMHDDPAGGRIVLVYRNPTEWKMCLSAENWPTPAGTLNQVSDRVFLVAGGERFPIRDFNTGDCLFGGCDLVVKPHQEVAAAIPYSEFSLPERLYGAPKALDFHPTAYACDAG